MDGNVSAQYRSTTNRTKRSPVYQYKLNDDGGAGYTMYGSTDTQRNTFTAVSNFQYLYGQLAVDYERQFGIHGLKASVTGDTRQVLTDYNLPEIPSNVMANASYDYAKNILHKLL